MFGMPYECYEQFHVRKYGFHGTSHRFVSMKYGEVTGKSLEGLNIVSCHLGNGSSITAIKDGKSIDTSMGFTPLDGIIMGTRSGSVDPSAVEFVENAPEVRKGVCENMEYLGIKLDSSVNDGLKGKLTKISAPDSKVEVWVIPTNEELLIARDTLEITGLDKNA